MPSNKPLQPINKIQGGYTIKNCKIHHHRNNDLRTTHLTLNSSALVQEHYYFSPPITTRISTKGPTSIYSALDNKVSCQKVHVPPLNETMPTYQKKKKKPRKLQIKKETLKLHEELL